jgi:hypothetical protein
MCGPTSGTQDRLIDTRSHQGSTDEEITMTTQNMFLEAEVDYRLDRAKSAFLKGRRHTVRRRRTLPLPQSRRRPVAVA